MGLARGVIYHCLLVLVLVCVASAEVCRADNVEVYYENFINSSDSRKIEAANQFFDELKSTGNIDTTYHYTRNADLPTVSSNVHYWMADYYYNASRYDQSLASGERALLSSSHIKDEALKSDIYSVLGIAHYRKGYFETALDYFQRGYAIDQRLGDNERLSSDLNNIASIYLAIRQPDAGITYIQRAIDLERKLGRDDRMAIRLGMASELYLSKKDYDRAQAMAREAYEIDRRANRTSKIGVRLAQMAAVYIETRQLDDAQAALAQAIPQLEQAGPKHSLAICYRLQGRLYHERGQSAQAVNYYRRALEMSREMGNQYEERNAEYGLWQTLRHVDERAALPHLERYSELADSMFKAESARQLGMFRAKYHTDELMHEKERMETRNRWIVVMSLILSLLLIAALIAAVYALRQKTRANKLMREVDSLRSGFMKNMTNELRNPLSVLMGVGNQMKASADASLQEQGNVITRQAATLMESLNELMGVSRATSPLSTPDWHRGDIIPYIKMTVENYHERSLRSGVSLRFQPSSASIVMDFVPDYVTLLLNHLLANALAFTPRDGHVTVKVARNGDKMWLTVADDGCGISPDDLPHIYDPFYRGKNANDKTSFGVGLALVKKIVTAAHGDVSVESTPGEGTTFTVKLPLERPTVSVSPYPDNSMPDTSGPKPAEAPAAHEARPLVLIVESHADMAYYIGNQLSHAYKVFYARNGVEGLGKVQELMPDLVVTAVQMPEMDGYELCRQIRSTDTVNHVPVLMVSSEEGNKERIRGIESGADGYLVKPFSGEELLSLADNMIKQRRSLQEKFAAPMPVTTTRPDALPAKADQEFLNKLVNLIHAQMSKGDIDLDTMATAMGMSRKQLRTRVQALTGEPTSAYVQRVRMGKAKRLVRTTNASIGEVASKCGFQDVAHFSRAFKQFFGVTPSQYRKNVD